MTDRTPATPCQFSDACTPADFAWWAREAERWAAAATTAARTDAQRWEASRLRTTAAMLSTDGADCNALSCQPFVMQLVAVVEQASARVREWGGELPGGDGWDWTDVLPNWPPGIPDAGGAPQWMWLIVGAVALWAVLDD